MRLKFACEKNDDYGFKNFAIKYLLILIKLKLGKFFNKLAK